MQLEARGGNISRNVMTVMAAEELFEKYVGVHKSKVRPRQEDACEEKLS